jgi:large subunit ribosomal protein L19
MSTQVNKTRHASPSKSFYHWLSQKGLQTMTTELIKEIEKEYLKPEGELPALNPGDSVKVMVRIREGNKERLQGYEGVIIKLAGAGVSKTITVRRVFQGVGVERVFLLHSPKVESIKVLRRGDVRRAKLYYLRERTGKAARIREKTTQK